MNYLTATDRAGVARLSVLGRGTETLQQQLEPLMEASPLLVLNVEGISFTSMLIGELVNVALRMEAIWKGRQQATICLVHVNENARKVLEMVRLTERIPIYSTVSEAMDHSISPPTAGEAVAS